MHLTRLASLHRLSNNTSLLVNALSGAVDLVDDEVRSQLQDLRMGRRPALQERYRALLTQRGYLFSGEGAERAALQKVWEAYRELAASRPLQFVVFPTYSCNLSCIYCFERPELRARPEVMAQQQIDNLFAAFGKIAAGRPGKSCQIVLFGGEPLLPVTEAAVADVLDRAKAAGLTVQVVTNGMYLPRFAPLFRRHIGTVKGAQITLDGPQPTHDARRRSANGRGSFAEVVQGVETCFDIGVEVNLRVNLDAHNLSHLEDLAQLLETRGWAGRRGFRCQLAPVTDHLGTSPYPFFMGEDELVEPVLELWRRRPELKEVLDFQLFRVLHHLISVIESGGRTRTLPRFHYCEADRGDVLSFGPDGLIYACPESAGSPQHAVGTYSPRYQMWPHRLRQWEGRNVLALPECEDCSIATFCGGGCAYAALQQCGGTAHGVCGRTREVVRAYVALLRRQYQNHELRIPA